MLQSRPLINGTASVTDLETVETTVGNAPSASVVWLHGLGADGHDFVPIVPELRLANVRFVFPHAPVIPVTLNGGMAMRAWFDLTTLEHTADEAIDHAGIARSVAAVTRLIDREVDRGIAAQRIVVAGFSQGGAVALATALAYPAGLAGIIGLSTWAAFATVAEDAANLETPVFLGHGEFDPVVAPSLGEQTRNLLRGKGMDVVWNAYPMAHAVCPEEIRDIAAFVHRVLP